MIDPVSTQYKLPKGKTVPSGSYEETEGISPLSTVVPADDRDAPIEPLSDVVKESAAKVTTVGHILINKNLPDDLQDSVTVWDKGHLSKTLQALSEKHPDKYKKSVYEIKRFGDQLAYDLGSSIRLRDLRPPFDIKKRFVDIEKRVASIKLSKLSDKQKDEKIAAEYAKFSGELEKEVYEKSLSQGNELTLMVASGARGNKNQLKSTIGAPVLVGDHKQRPILVPIQNSYSQGVDPAEYWAASYGTRQGVISTKFATQEAGAFGKQLSRSASEMIVTEDDCGTNNGIARRVEDPEILDQFLVGIGNKFPRNTLITPETVRELKKAGLTKLLVRSPLTCEAAKGICKYCAGLGEKNRLYDKGENIGINAAASLAEPLSQGGLDVKHTGGVIGARKPTAMGFKYITQLTHVPKLFQNRAAIAEAGGKIDSIKEAPQGGNIITIAGKEHYSLPGHDLLVKPGQTVEPGDRLSEGIVNPTDIVRLKGLGVGRKFLAETLKEAFDESGMKIARKNFEVMARSMINHVQVADSDEIDDALPDDIVEYQAVIKGYKGIKAQSVKIDESEGKYLAKQYLHFSIGTKITPSVINEIREDLGLKEILVTDREPPFRPLMLRLPDVPRFGGDWMQRMQATHLQESLLRGTHRGDVSSVHGTGFVNPLAKGTEFGRPGPGKIGY